VRKILLALSLCSVSGFAQLSIGGNSVVGGAVVGTGYLTPAPAISGLTLSPSATTIVGTWSTQTVSSSSMACSTTPGSYTINAVDNGTQTAVLTHQSGLGGIAASTTYYCQVTSTNSVGSTQAVASVTTTAAQSSTAITGLVLGTATAYNSLNGANQGCADTYNMAVSNDGKTYLTNADTIGPGGPCSFTESGVPGNTSASMSMMVMTSESPYAIQTLNNMTAYGACCSPTGDDNLSQKPTGLISVAGNLFLSTSREGSTSTTSGFNKPYFPFTSQQIKMSPDHGLTWNNFQSPNNFIANGNPTTPASASMFPVTSFTNWGSSAFVSYCGDDGTLGYLISCNRHDNGELYVYGIANEGVNYAGGTGAGCGGNAFYEWRISRAKMKNLNIADYQYFTGGDGSSDSNWSATASAAVAIISNPCSLSNAAIQYIPAKNRYLLLTYSAPAGVLTDTSATQWLGYESPHPWGPWTLIYTQNFTGNGPYNPIIVNRTAWTGTTPTLLYTGNFANVSIYQMYIAPLTIN
jgi:hypothetical protein